MEKEFKLGITMQKLFSLIILLLAISCGENTFNKQSNHSSSKAKNVEKLSLNSCSNNTYIRPKVDILYVVDNSSSSFNIDYIVKQEIANSISLMSNTFDYHIMVAPLLPTAGEVSLSSFPVMLFDPSSVSNLSTINAVSANVLQFFSTVSNGNNHEPGFQRVRSIINANRSNNIFRQGSNLLVVMISSGDDTDDPESTYVNGNQVGNPAATINFRNHVDAFKSYTKKWYDENGITNYENQSRGPSSITDSYLKAEQFRFLSVVAHSNNGICSGYRQGVRYKAMSNALHDYASGANSSYKDSFNLCSGGYSKLFDNLNSTIKDIVIKHKYNYWKISNSDPSAIEETDINVYKIDKDGDKTKISRGGSNGFTYEGYQTDVDVCYDPQDCTELQTGHIIKLNGSARVTYPDCIIAKTKTPTEYFGYIAIPRKPDLSEVKLKINGKTISESNSNGWSSYNSNSHTEKLNIKVPGPTNASITPAVYKSGYMLKLHGNAIYTNGDTTDVYYKAD